MIQPPSKSDQTLFLQSYDERGKTNSENWKLADPDKSLTVTILRKGKYCFF